MADTKVQRVDVHRLLCAVYGTRLEARLERVVGSCYARNEHGVAGFIGDRLDDLRCLSIRTRAWVKVHLTERGR